jgi:hypothetical protein
MIEKVLNTRICCPEGTLQTILDITVKIEQKISIFIVSQSVYDDDCREGDQV